MFERAAKRILHASRASSRDALSTWFWEGAARVHLRNSALYGPYGRGAFRSIASQAPAWDRLWVRFVLTMAITGRSSLSRETAFAEEGRLATSHFQFFPHCGED